MHTIVQMPVLHDAYALCKHIQGASLLLQGGFGVVCKAYYRVHYNKVKTVAVKMGKYSNQDALQEEMQKLMGLRSNYILQFWGFSWMEVCDRRTLLLVTEYMDRGSLYAPCCAAHLDSYKVEHVQV